MSRLHDIDANEATTARGGHSTMRATRPRVSRPARGALAVLLALAACLLVTAPAASAAVAPAPAWSLAATSQPTNFPAGATVAYPGPAYYIVATNRGGAPTSGPVTITDTLPADLTAEQAFGKEVDGEFFECAIAGETVTCEAGASPVRPGEHIAIEIFVDVAAGASGTITNEATVSGGAPTASRATETPISSAEASFGFLSGSAGFADSLTEADGSAATQAGSHPYALTVETRFPAGDPGGVLRNAAGGHVRDLHVDLPKGMVVNPFATPVRCTEAQLESTGCPLASQIGLITLNTDSVRSATANEPLYNMVPPAGKPAEFGFEIEGLGFYIHIMGGVDPGSGYALSGGSSDILAKLPIVGIQVTFWGNPSDPSHNTLRGACTLGGYSNCELSVPTTTTPLLTAPTSCGTPLTVTGSTDSWNEPSNVKTASAELGDLAGNPLALSGCSKLAFEPSIEVTPESAAADSPSGLQVDLKIPQTEGLNTLATADLKKAVVALPAGMTVNPSAANGMAACSEAQIGMHSSEPVKCPDASKIGSVEVTTPLLSDVLKGGVYLAQQGNVAGGGSNPFGSLLAIYLTAEADGVLIKLAGKVEANPVTGQLTATFDENPQLPFEDFKLSFFGGERAALATPSTCGQYGASASFTSWAQPENPVGPQVQPFTISSGPGGAACSTLGFSPSFQAGTSSNQAGSYSPFVMNLSRKDGEQRLGAVSLEMPAGLAGVISHVTPCAEAQADAGTCPVASQIGRATIAAGVGGEPATLPEPGRPEDPVYLTQPYKGAPFGIAVVVHAEAGPFNLGTVVVRGTVNVNPSTAQVSIATDASGPYATPTILQGIPVDVRAIDIEVNKTGFMFNPTSCEPTSVTGTIGSAEGASAGVSSRFQAAGCQSLAFGPKFGVSTSAHASRANGASLDVKLSYPTGSLGAQANIKRVRVELPKALPSRLSTLQKACTAKQFETNPAGCPPASVVGHAVVHTQVLPVALEGPAYFVSHGGEAFPNLILVLQGDGVTIQLVGDTAIKGGVTSSTFASTPDVPIETFELVLPEGEHSALAANGDLCRQKLAMPTAFTAQNGTTLNQNTSIQVEGCANALAVRSKKIKGRTVTLGVWVPAAGHLTASGKGLTSASKASHTGEQVKLTLHAQHSGKFTSKIRLTFTPSSGKDRKKLNKSLTVRI
jgi:uncharacterized repeat protein (TIGR01451 family)